MNPLPDNGSTITGMPMVLGFYDYIEIKRLDKFNDLLSNELSSIHSNTLTRKISLVDSESSEVPLDSYLNKKITFVCMAKLNSRTFFSDSIATNSNSALDEIKQLIDDAIGDYKKASNFRIKIAWSLSVYDVVLLIQHDDPNVMAEAFLTIKQKVHKLAFSTSFFVVDFSDEAMINYAKLYDTANPKGIDVKLNIRMKFTVKQTDKLDDIKNSLKNELLIASDESLFMGYTPGDTDVAFAAKDVSLLNALTLFNKLNNNIAPKEMTDVVKHLQSSFSLHDPAEECIVDQDARDKAMLQHDKGWKQYASVKDAYQEMKSGGMLPPICYNTIENILLAFEYLYNLREHHDVALKFILLLEKGLETHKKHLHAPAAKSTARRPAIIDFVHDLNLSLRSIASAGTIYMDRMLELHPMNPYSKLFFSFEHIAKRIYSELPHCCDAKEFEVFLTMSKKMTFNSTRHFVTTPGNVSLVAIDVPHPQFFSLKDSILPLLHEVSHFCDGGVMKKAALEDIVLNFIAIEVCADKNGRIRGPHHPSEQNQVFRNLHELYEKARSALAEINCQHEPEIHDILNYILGINVFDNGKLVDKLLNVSNEVFNVIKDFAFDDDYSFIRDLSNVFDEAMADILMLEMSGSDGAKEKLCRYVKFLCDYFEKSYINPLNGANKQIFPFVRRCFFVFEFYGYTFKKLADDTSLIKDVRDMLSRLTHQEYAVYRFDILAEIFKRYLKIIIGGENLHENVKSKIMGSPNGKDLDQLDASEEVRLHLDSWYLGLKPD